MSLYYHNQEYSGYRRIAKRGYKYNSYNRAKDRAGGQTVFSTTAEYSLRAAVHLAMSPNHPLTTQEIADATHVPMPYLSKVLQALVRANIVVTRRGLHGGCMLQRSPELITVFEVVEAVDPIKRITYCPLGLAAHGTHLCPLHRRLDNAIESVECSFRDTTLAEVINEPSSSRPLGGLFSCTEHLNTE